MEIEKREKYEKIREEIKKRIEEEKRNNDRLFSSVLNSKIASSEFINASDILAKMNKNQVINFHGILEKVIKGWKIKNIRPKIILHSCCAPCSTYSLEFLCQYADITILFANSNIHPKKEYEKRSKVQKDFIIEFNKRTGNNVQFIEAEYKPSEFFKTVRGLEDEPEGGKRCEVCFNMRLDIVAKYAKELNFDYFASAITLSAKKNSKLINEIGFEIQEIYEVKYLPTDFKKNGGGKRSIEMCNEYDVYRQCYCGCIFALNKQLEQQKEREGNNGKYNINE